VTRHFCHISRKNMTLSHTKIFFWAGDVFCHFLLKKCHFWPRRYKKFESEEMWRFGWDSGSVLVEVLPRFPSQIWGSDVTFVTFFGDKQCDASLLSHFSRIWRSRTRKYFLKLVTFFVTRGNMGWSFRQQISFQVVDVTKPWRATPGHKHRFKVSSAWKQRVYYVTGTIQILDKCFEFK